MFGQSLCKEIAVTSTLIWPPCHGAFAKLRSSACGLHESNVSTNGDDLFGWKEKISLYCRVKQSGTQFCCATIPIKLVHYHFSGA